MAGSRERVSAFKRFRYLLEELGCRFLAALLPRLSRSACVWTGEVLGSLAFRLDLRGRSVALENLRCAFGERFTPTERSAIARASYQNFARTMLDLFWAARLDQSSWQDWMKVEGFESVRERLSREGRGTIFMCVHQGNWEWASLACGFLGFGNVVVAENFKNPRLTEIFRARRQHSGQSLIDQENSLLKMLRLVKKGGATGMLIDLNLRPTQAAAVIEAFGPGGLKMCVPLLHAVLAERGGALLVPVETHPEPSGVCGSSRILRWSCRPTRKLPTSHNGAGTRSNRSCRLGRRAISGHTNTSAFGHVPPHQNATRPTPTSPVNLKSS
jgi:lauroyl/myristoyl acyltransferase